MAEEVKKRTRKTTAKVEEKTEVKVEEKVVEEKKVRKPRAKKVDAPVEETVKVEEAVEVAPTEEVKEVKKAPKKAKKAEKVEVEKVEPKKVEEKKVEVRTSAKASGLTLKVTPRKMRLVIDLVRGKDVHEALEILDNTHKEGSKMAAKVIKSAVANAVNNFNMDEDKLYVSSIMVSDSVKMRRFLPRAKGSASGMVKRFSNLYVVVSLKD